MPRNILISGANRGIGLEFTRQLLGAGDHVVAACRHPGKATALNELAGEYPGRLHVLPLDVADAKSRASLVHDLIYATVTATRAPVRSQHWATSARN